MRAGWRMRRMGVRVWKRGSEKGIGFCGRWSWGKGWWRPWSVTRRRREGWMEQTACSLMRGILPCGSVSAHVFCKIQKPLLYLLLSLLDGLLKPFRRICIRLIRHIRLLSILQLCFFRSLAMLKFENNSLRSIRRSHDRGIHDVIELVMGCEQLVEQLGACPRRVEDVDALGTVFVRFARHLEWERVGLQRCGVRDTNVSCCALSMLIKGFPREADNIDFRDKCEDFLLHPLTGQTRPPSDTTHLPSNQSQSQSSQKPPSPNPQKP